jgi:hypothetical protein
MGVMFATALAMRTGQRLDRAAGKQAIEELTLEMLSQLVDDFAPDDDVDMRQRLRDALQNAREAVEGWNRECATLSFGPWTLFVTGGMGSGDPPTDLYDDVAWLDASGVASSIGFAWPPETHPQKQVAPTIGAA